MLSPAELDSFRTGVSEKVRQYTAPDAPTPLKIMAAKALVPMNPVELCQALCLLSHESDAAVASIAQSSLDGLPENVAQAALAQHAFAPVLDFLAQRWLGKPRRLEIIVSNPAVSNATLTRLAMVEDETLCEIIATNQSRCLSHPPILNMLRANPVIRPATLQALLELAVRQGVIAAPAAGSEAEIVPDLTLVLPDELLNEGEAVAEKARATLSAMLGRMTPGQKLALAQKGNKEVRTVMVKDSNRLVAMAAIRNPRFSEPEVVLVSANRSIHEDVVREVCKNREWTKNYQVKLNLVNNPKVPIASSMQFLKFLNSRDLKNVVGNKNIPSALSQLAKKMMREQG